MRNIEHSGKSAFEKRFDILIYAVHSKRDFSVKDIFDSVLECSRITICSCVKDLVNLGYLVKKSTYTYEATETAKQLFGVKA